ncbi:MAG: c-type cytochrome [Pseudomonadota bacterium]
MRLTAFAILALLATAAQAAAAGDPALGRQKAALCRACHGIDGVARVPNAATIAGETEFYLTKQLKAFRAGERKDPQMSIVAQSLSDEDIANLAAWFSSIKITVQVPGE